MKHWFTFVLLGWLSLAQAGPFGDDELLPADQAFAFSASVEGDHIRAVWDIADGYYLYKSKLRFSTDAADVGLGEPQLPRGETKQDEFFGTIETYRQSAVIKVPLTRRPATASEFTISALSQGCADIGVCYPPQTQTVALNLPASSTATNGSTDSAKESSPKSILDLGEKFGFGDQEELLPADQAFRPDVTVGDDGTLTANWQIADGYYLYRHRFEFSLAENPTVTLLPAV
ncbi:MAG: protein-disulfide reductase DsbD family protein, partial [Gammaproteobacteria bacterium]